MQDAGISVRSVSKGFRPERRALDAVSLDVAPGEMVALIGASGSGKSTLLRHIAGFVAADPGTGRIEVSGRVVQANGRISRDLWRVRAGIGFVFQQFNLVGRLTVMTNVLTGLLHRVPRTRGLLFRFTEEERVEALTAMASVGIADLAWQRASTLSGGQQQRAAIARTLVQGAQVILADEPIASLDPESARNIMDILASLNRDRGRTVVVSLHQVEFALRYCTRTIALHGGKVVFDGPSAHLTPALLRQLYGNAADELHAAPVADPPRPGLPLSALGAAA
jgi:phosphonate transport system ATP-binding protein